MNLQEKLEKEVEEHNELHNNIVAGEQQLQAMKDDKQRRVGRIQLLQEQIQEQQNDTPIDVPGDISGG